MDFDRGHTRIYNCPICGVDTPHVVKGRRGDTYAVVCSNCSGGSLVKGDDLRIYQVRWEEELRQILESLETPDGED